MSESLLTVSDVARRLEVAPDTVRLWNRLGKLRASRLNSGMRLFAEQDVCEFAKAREQRKATAAVA